MDACSIAIFNLNEGFMSYSVKCFELSYKLIQLLYALTEAGRGILEGVRGGKLCIWWHLVLPLVK